MNNNLQDRIILEKRREQLTKLDDDYAKEKFNRS